jgi:hypothetical protein
VKLEEQEKTKQKQYVKAMRYFDNAKEVLSKTAIKGVFYKDKKCVSSACGLAYKGVLVALDCWLKLKEVEFPKKGKKRKSIYFYMDNLQRHNEEMVKYLNTVHNVLLLNGYYDRITDSRMIEAGFSNAKELIDLIKPKASEPWCKKLANYFGKVDLDIDLKALRSR